MSLFYFKSLQITDKFGRKTTLLLSSLCSVINLLLILWGVHLAVFIIAMIFSALTNTLASGTMTSLVYESITELQTKTEETYSFKRVSAILHSLWPIGAAITSIIGGILAKNDLRLPIAAMLIPVIISILLKSQLIDPYTDTAEMQQSLWHQTKDAYQILTNNRQVLILVGIGFFSYIGEVTHKLKPLYFAFKHIPLPVFGLLFAATFGLSFVGSILSDPVSSRYGNKSAILMMQAFSQLMSMASLLTDGIISGILLAMSSLSWGIQWPIISDLLNAELDNHHRTTVLSISNMVKMISFTLFGPIFGYIVDRYNILTLYWIDWGISLILILPYFFLKET